MGDVTLSELADRYGVAERTLQKHFSQHASRKGARAAEVASQIRQEIFDNELPETELIAERARDVRERAYKNANALEDLVMAQVEIARTDPSQAMRASTVLKGLAIAASALERLHGLKFRALGLENVVEEAELPVLRIVEMTAAEEEELRASHGDSDNPDELVDDEPDLDQAPHSSTRLSPAPDLYVGDDQLDEEDDNVISQVVTVPR
jgi:hypothetical protein